ncbi:MAG: sn-glycerol-1-phosphate dehydrogenase [Alphaproteobacteria bacterium]|nr:sn-glycerol-1-phosphate dehydrogenase [Alphaproteobacteria bacterium]
MSDWESEIRAIAQPAIARSKAIASLEVGRGILRDAGDIIRRDFDGTNVVVFADEAGFAAAGPAFVASAERAGFAVRAHVIPARPRPKASAELSESFEPLIATDTIPVALGSGVINDLVKLAAFRRDRPYCVVATAASMDGYASAGAPLSKNGFKMTIAARCPRSIIADLDVIAAAPAEMAGWGYGDLAGKIPAGADWIIADALGIEPLDPNVWPLVQGRLGDWLGDPSGVRAGDFAAVAKLFAGLVMGGLAMEFHGSSRPASGAEHQIAHMWEMQGLTFAGERVSHGACVGVGTVTVLSLYQWLLAQDLSALDIGRAVNAARDLDAKYAEIDRLIPASRIAERARAETAAKHVDGNALGARLMRLVKGWPELKRRLATQVVPPWEMAEWLKAAGAPVSAADIGVAPADFETTVRAARFLRSRYTIFDLLDETGLLDAALHDVGIAGTGQG